MLDYINIGSTPPEEDCAGVGSPNYHSKAMKECREYINLLIRKLGPEQGSSYLKIKAFPHDFGTYYEVVCMYDDSDQIGLEYALQCEGYGPEKWDDEARIKLGLEVQK